MALASSFLSPFVTPIAFNLNTKITSGGNAWNNLGFNKSADLKLNQKIHAKGFRVNCIVQIEKPQTESKSYSGDQVDQIDTNGAPTSDRQNQPRQPSLSTLVVDYHNEFDPYKATSTPIYQTATFKQQSAIEAGEYMYSRSENPTRDTLERLIAKLENASKAYCLSSGMSALTVVFELVKPGDEVVAVEDIYGGSHRFLSELVSRKEGVELNRIDATDLEKVKSTLERGRTRLVWLESPTNPQLKICDIRKISEMAHEHGAIVLMDNSVMSPVLCRPLDLGVDIVVNSATKFISGNSNVMAGVVATKDEELASHLENLKNAIGSALSPFDSWLCLEGIKTMVLRVEKKQENAKKVAEYLAQHPQVRKVNYPGLSDHPGYELHNSQADGPGSVLSFETHSFPLSKHIVEKTEHFGITVSFGSVGSAICMPWFTSHASIPEAERESMGVCQELVRLSVGIEDPDDLIADLDNAFSTYPTKVSFWF
ncbi:cystathionine beta-lyase, chloroplastic-like [Prosopis cineraria]|uniref:cystathionine beta-lyase, chloroplastic-like n=1 Tax=Prosopis cineraria TaxID=364024 RepID=UPI0024108D60|nr:cystathionine beta-lyase, chloroplastic-like [Prosopis cineraria]